jgi:Amiloride-sensitive sodium channel
VAAYDIFTFVSVKTNQRSLKYDFLVFDGLLGESSSKTCNEEDDFMCFSNVDLSLVDEEGLTFKSCDCLDSCSFIDYKVVRYTTRMKYDERHRNDSSFSASGSVYFDDDEFIALKRSASYGNVGMLSNIGGLLGLFLGMSVLSVVETFYFFIIRFVNNLWWTES